MKLLAKIFIIAVALSSCSFFSFNPSASLDSKWLKIKEWVPGDGKYFILADINKIVRAELGSDLPQEAGIIALTKDFTFIGGKFDTKIFFSKIAKNYRGLNEQKVLDKIIYTDPDSKASFSFLEKYLLCQGKEKALKELIQKHADKKIVPPNADTSHMLSGQLDYKADIKLTGDIGQALILKARANFPSAKNAADFTEELRGVKTIKLIQLVDEPWLADILDNVKIEQTDKEVVISTSLDTASAKKLIKKYFL